VANPSRFDRTFELTVTPPSGRAVVVRSPMRIVFNVSKSVAGGLNVADIKLYNLSETNRLALARNPEDSTYVRVELKVGYGGTLALVYKGSLLRGTNSREGADLITTLNSKDGWTDQQNSFSSRTVKGKSGAIYALLADMPNTARGKLTEQTPLLRPKVLVGQTMQLVDSLIADDATWFIDDEKLYILKDDEVISSYIPVVNAATGLLDTPTRENYRLTFKTLLNPALRIGQLCEMQSVTAPYFNGVYRIDAIGILGDNYGTDWTQTVTCLAANNYKVI
jgi:hypothetical protein